MLQNACLILFRERDAVVAPYPALGDESNYSKNPSVKSIIFRSFLGSSKGRCSALHSEACCSKKPLLKSIISRLIACPLRGLCIACRNSTTKTQGVRFLGRLAGSSAGRRAHRPRPISPSAGRACFLKNLWEHGNMGTFFPPIFEFSGFSADFLISKMAKIRVFKGPPL